MGRSNDYKNNPECLYIPDLKVPKKYIRVSTDKTSVVSHVETTLTVQFQSICTTDVNGTIYKLKNKDSNPFDINIRDVTTLKVNPNKTDLIWITARWQPILIFHPGKLNEDLSVQEKLLEIYNGGLDIRLTENPLCATHFMTLHEDPEVDVALRICVLQGIPIVKPAFVDYIMEYLHNVSSWFETVPPKFLLPTDYANPNLDRGHLLRGKTPLVVFDSNSLAKLKDLERWLPCLRPDRVVSIDINSPDLETKLKAFAGSDKIDYIIDLGANLALSPYSYVFTKCNSISDLWKSTVTVDTSNLHTVEPLLLICPPKDAKRATNDESTSLRLTQRKRRRKVERVSETDFFLFSSAAPTQAGSDIVPMADKPSETQVSLSVMPTQETLIPSVDKSKPKPGEPGNASKYNSHLKDAQEHLLLSTKSSDTLEIENVLVASKVIDTVEDKDVVKDEAVHVPKKQKLDNGTSLKISHLVQKNNILSNGKRQVSFAEAVKSTKLKAEQGIKDEFYEGEPIEDGIQNLVIVEEITLVRPKASIPFEVENPQYKGRKNFKAFRKSGQPRTHRQYLQLYDEGSQIAVSHIAEVSATRQAAHDLDGEIGSVKGFQPDSQPLFVTEDENVDEFDGGFQFLNGNQSKEVVESDVDSDDGPRFKFST